MTYQITHSGRTFQSLGRGPNGCEVWPIEEYLVRRKHTPAVAARIRRLNADGKEEGTRPRGWYPHARSFISFDVVTISEFRDRHGSEVLRSVPRSFFVKVGGKRRAISAAAYHARFGAVA